MTKGPGRSDCYRVGVTYGYREYLRKGRVRQKLRRKFAGSQDSSNLRRASFAKAAFQNASLIYSYATSVKSPQKHFAVFLRDRISRKLSANDCDFLQLNVGFF
jgi:hypothetical protein